MYLIDANWTEPFSFSKGSLVSAMPHKLNLAFALQPRQPRL